MRNLLAFLAAVVLAVAGLGWYLDWFRIKATPAPTGQRSLQIDIHTDKITSDIHRGGEYLLDKGSEQLQKAAEKTSKPSDTNKLPAGKAPAGN
jgi:hypothetical protein